MPPFYLVTFMTATVVATSVTLAVMVVVVAFYIRIESERASEECFDCSIAGTVNTTEKLDTGRQGLCHILRKNCPLEYTPNCPHLFAISVTFISVSSKSLSASLILVFKIRLFKFIPVSFFVMR